MKKQSVSSRRAGQVSVSAEDIFNRPLTKRQLATARRLAAKQRAGDDSDSDFSDIPELTDGQLANMVPLRDARPKVAVSVRLEPRVLEWLKSPGPGHLTRINDILVACMTAARKR